jgi:hypothetical protein
MSSFTRTPTLTNTTFLPPFNTLQLYQLTHQDFQTSCLQVNLPTTIEDGDSTGLRVYAGAHVLVRLLGLFPRILDYDFNDERSSETRSGGIIELGCGTGVVGILGLVALTKDRMTTLFNKEDFYSSTFKTEETSESNNKVENLLPLLMCTDGSLSAIELTRMNQALHLSKHGNVKAERLYWTSDPAPIHAFLNEHNGGRPFSVVLGSELFYYRTKPDELLKTVFHLLGGIGDMTYNSDDDNNMVLKQQHQQQPQKTMNTNSPSLPTTALFIHTHIFRGGHSTHESKIIRFFKSLNWVTYEIPLKYLVPSPKERLCFPSARCLISGELGIVEKVLEDCGIESYVEFLGVEDCGIDSYVEFLGMFDCKTEDYEGDY